MGCAEMLKVVIARTKASLLENIVELLDFLRKPGVHRTADQPRSRRLATGIWLFLASLAVTAIFALLTLPLVLVAEAGPSTALRQTFSNSLLAVVVAVVIVGPLIEELIFRGWLTGTWRSLAGNALFLAIFYGGAALMSELDVGPAGVKSLGLVALGLAVVWLLRPLGSRARVPGYDRIFPFLFWGQGIIFGLLHYQNFSAASPILAVMMTLPLIVCAWLWGYARIVLGIGGAVLLHAAYNVPVVVGMIAMGGA